MWGWFLHRYDRIVDYAVEKNVTEVCYKATAYGPEILCKDLPDWLDPRFVASWHPVGKAGHLVEWIGGSIVGLGILFTIMPSMKGLWGRTDRHRRPMHWVYLIVVAIHLYKYNFFLTFPYRGWATTPCHMGWIFRLFMHFVPLSEPVGDALCQTLLSWTCLAILFILENGEITDAIHDGYLTWSVFHHSMLISIPGYDIVTGRVALLPPPPPRRPKSWIRYYVKWLMKTHMISHGAYLLMYATFITPISLLSGVNWGWTLFFHPSQGSDDLGLSTPHVRLWWTLYTTIFFSMIRLVWIIFEGLLRLAGLSPFCTTPTNVTVAPRPPDTSSTKEELPPMASTISDTSPNEKED